MVSTVVYLDSIFEYMGKYYRVEVPESIREYKSFDIALLKSAVISNMDVIEHHSRKANIPILFMNLTLYVSFLDTCVEIVAIFVDGKKMY